MIGDTVNLAARLEQLTKDTGARLLAQRSGARRGRGERRGRSRRAADPRLRGAGARLEAAVIWYFAYGSNMNPARLADQRLKERAVQMGPRIGGRLDGWRLTFNKIARSPRERAPATSSKRRARSCTAR